MGRFISEDTLLGEPIDPPSLHLYAYGAGEPIAHWDPDGRKVVWLDRNYQWNGSAWRYDTGNIAQTVSVVPICRFCAPIPIKFRSTVRWRGDLVPNNRLARWTLFSLATHNTRTDLAPVWIRIIVKASATFKDGTVVPLDWYQSVQGNGGIRCALCASLTVGVPMRRGRIVRSKLTASLWYQFPGFEEPLFPAIFEYRIAWHRT